MNFIEAVQFIDKSYSYGTKLDLEHMKILLQILGNPQDQLKFIHIAGTNGKGSTSSFIHSMLKAEGYKVGLFTSPHLHCYTDRIRINGVNISKEDFALYTSIVEETIAPFYEQGFNHPALFDIATLMAMMYFAKEKVDYVVLEVGLGGLNDATNIISQSLVSVITPIGIDHVDILGSDLKQIARHKAGIIKPQGSVISTWQDPIVEEVLAETAAQQNAALYFLRKEQIHMIHQDFKEQIFHLDTSYGILDDCKIRMIGDHQIFNGALAAVTLVTLREDNVLAISNESIYQGLYENYWAGRLELLQDNPLILIDGAHNVQGSEVLASALTQYFNNKKINLVIGMLKDKDVDGVLNNLIPFAHKVIFTKPNNPKAMDPEELANRVNFFGKEIHITQTIEESVGLALENTSLDEITIFTGSLYLIGDARKIITEFIENRREAS